MKVSRGGGADQGADLAEQDRQGGQVARGVAEFADRVAGSCYGGGVALFPLVHAGLGVRVGGRRVQDLRRQGGQGGVQVVAQGHAGQRLPAVLPRQVGDLRQQVVHAEALRQHVVDRGDLV